LHACQLWWVRMILKEDKKSIGSVHAHGSSGCGHC
jgi:hypothetical protein